MHALSLRLLRIYVLAVAIFSLVSARGLNHPRALVPDLDPFYRPPAGFESTAPGTILRNRRIVASFWGSVPAPVEAWQLLYRTTAINGTPIATVTTVFKPLFAKNDRFVSFQTAYDSSATICNPSYNYQLGSLQTDLVSSAEFWTIQAYLLSGYIVASPDYEGPEAAWCMGRIEGTGVLDGMRAVLNFQNKLGLSTNKPKIVGVGYSGGGHATGWAAALHSNYAPELDVKGWAFGGAAVNLSATFEDLDGKAAAGFIPIAIAGLSKPSTYGAAMQPLLQQILTADGRKYLDIANSQCLTSNILSFVGQKALSTKFQSLGDRALYHPTIASILEQNRLGGRKEEIPKAPVYLVHSALDEFISYQNQTTLFNSWCNNGANIKFTTFAKGGHITTAVLSIPSTLAFVADAFEGRVQSGCLAKTILDTNIALPLNLEPLAIGLANILLVAGQGDINIINNIETLKKTV